MIEEVRFSSISSIKAANLRFSPNLNVIVGETGTGKTLILNLFRLLSGERMPFPIKEEPFIEASFREDNQETHIRREILPRSSRYFINGRRTTRKTAHEMVSSLMVFQLQRLSTYLLKPSYQLRILDSFSKNEALLSKYSGLFLRLRKIQLELRKLKREDENRNEEMEFLRFQEREIESANLRRNEEEELLSLRDRISKAESIRNFLKLSRERLYDSDTSAFSQVSRVISELERLNVKTSILDRLNAVQDEIESIVSDIEREFGNVESGPSIDEIESRLYDIDRIKSKYGGTYESVMEHLNKVKERLKNLESLSERIKQKEAEAENLEKELLRISGEITERRRKYAELLEERILENLKDMYLEDARFEVELRRLDTLGPNGAEDVEFLFSGNPKLPLSPLSRAISGGELSRFLISLFDVMTGSNTTMVLDEIDVGMSGRVLSSVAKKLREVSRKNQIIAVTHSPQVAAMADRMFKVERSPSNEITIRQLSEDEFESEIAVMISGKRTAGSLEAAKELLERR